MIEKEKVYLYLSEIEDYFPKLKIRTIQRMIKEQIFPVGKKLRGRTLWSNLEIESWLDERGE